MWGTRARQRLRLGPLYAAMLLAEAGGRSPARRVNECTHGWRAGISVVVPDRDAPDMLREALLSVHAALERLGEPAQVIVVANGADAARYDVVRPAFPHVDFVHSVPPLGFGTAILRGLEGVRHDWTLLLNNDMTLDPQALCELARHRAPGVFSLSAQIFQRSADGRREETGFTDWYADCAGIHAYHAPVRDGLDAVPHLAGSGGATLFRTAPLIRYVADGACYEPFYWEDIEWGVRAWQDGYRVLFCSGAHAQHRHRATTARFYEAAEIDRIVARNALLFDARNRATRFGLDWLMNRVCDLPYASQRELASRRVAAEVLQHRARARGRTLPSAAPVLADPNRAVSELADASFSYRLRPLATSSRPRVLVVTPFAVFPPRHGGARRIAGLLGRLRRDFDVILVTDEATLYDARSFAGFDELCAVHLVQRETDAKDGEATLEARMRSHDHPALAEVVHAAILRYRPAIVQIEHAELASMIRYREEGQRWVLGLHDAYGPADFATPAQAARFQDDVLGHYDAITVCSDEDRRLVVHRDVTCVPNATSLEPLAYVPSTAAQLLFLGPFRYGPNLAGVRRFLAEAYPAIRAAVPAAMLCVGGGDGSSRIVANDAAFARPDVEVLEHRDDVADLLARATLTINPLEGIRGSSIKLIESLAAGRVCVSTVEGARGFLDAGLPGLVVAAGVAAMAAPIITLLQDAAERHRLEAPDSVRLAQFGWDHAAQLQEALYTRLIGASGG